MKFFSVFCSSLFQISSVLFVLGYFVGVLDLYYSETDNHCIMTYMFEFPQFVRLNVEEDKVYSQYGLYAYSEGRFTEKSRKLQFDGVPVLFLPGNSGSQMQARSIASVALRKALSQGYEFHFDFFTISFNEELSGLNGGVLLSQTKFAAASVLEILKLYNQYTKSVPTSVILIGHSMGGVLAKRLLAYPDTINVTRVAIALAAPLKSPVINFDSKMEEYYANMDLEWQTIINSNNKIKNKKVLLSFGNGPRDVLVPASLISSSYSYISALTTSIPGVWVSPDHVSIVWCKQLVMAINRFLFSIIDPKTEQLVQDRQILLARAKQYFQANRSIDLSRRIQRGKVAMVADAFWYEDNRRIYQIIRPEIVKTTYLMIRLVKFPQNRFVAVESVNASGDDWIFGCNAKYTYNTYRYCKNATSLSELSRWTGAAAGFGKRKLATVQLHNLMELHPEWTHVVVRVLPTKKPITLNVDINDLASRVITVDLPAEMSYAKYDIIAETERDSLYYELILPGFTTITQAYLLYVEPTINCKANHYHVSAEVHVPWAKNHEYYHYFTHTKKSPMKLRIFQTHPNVTATIENTEHVKVTLLLHPQCTFSVSISKAWYLQLSQLVRYYTPALIPYVASIILLSARGSLVNLRNKGVILSIHQVLLTSGIKPHIVLVIAKVFVLIIEGLSYSSLLMEDASWQNIEMRVFTRSIFVAPVYMIAVGIINIAATVLLLTVILLSQISKKILFRLTWRGVDVSFKRITHTASLVLLGIPHLSCGAVSLVAGALFYIYLLSKFYEEYMEENVDNVIANIEAPVGQMLNSTRDKHTKTIPRGHNSKSKLSTKSSNASTTEKLEEEQMCNETQINESEHVNMALNRFNFHMILFLMWLFVTLIHVPALLMWAKNYKYNSRLPFDTSLNTSLIMSLCSIIVWKIKKPSINRKIYNVLRTLLLSMAVLILTLGPISLTMANFGVTFIFLLITLQQLLEMDINEDILPFNDNLQAYYAANDLNRSNRAGANNAANDLDGSNNSGANNAANDLDGSNNSGANNAANDLDGSNNSDEGAD